jgi:dTDP-4-dehydrorhamnose reductase
MDIADLGTVEAALDCHRPWAVINAAGYVRVAQAEQEPDRCRRENVVGAENLAKAAAARGIPLVTFSSDLVFDGSQGAYSESDVVSPTSVYGVAKAEAERRVLKVHPDTLVIRTSAFFGPWDRYNFVWWVLSELSSGRTIEAKSDLVSPTYVPDLVHEVLNLLIDGTTGIWHLANKGSVTWADLARMVALRAGFDPGLICELPADVPLNTALTSERGILMPPLDNAVHRFFAESEVNWSVDRTLSIAAE